jgi:hypothetical protein
MSDDPIDAELPDDDPDDEHALERIPAGIARVPMNITELAATGGAVENIQRRGASLDMARRIMVAATFPADYVAFRDPDGRVTLYLQNKGAWRIRDVIGIETFDLGTPERIPTADPKVFYYIQRASARSRLTGQVIENVEGGRSSTEDFCKGKSGVDLELTVRKAARASLEGRAARMLAGLEGIPAEFVDEVWKDTAKRTAQCPHGKGFGSRDERLGAAPANAPDVEPPVCPHCKARGVYRPAKGDRGAFYGCPNYSKHPDKKFIVPADKWIADHPAKLTPAQAAGFTGAPTAPPPVDEVFGNGKTREREPGEDDE